MGPHKLLNKEPNGRWFETNWRSFDRRNDYIAYTGIFAPVKTQAFRRLFSDVRPLYEQILNGLSIPETSFN